MASIDQTKIQFKKFNSQKYDKHSPEAQALIDAVIERFKKDHPQSMNKVILPYIETLMWQIENDQYNYSLFDGETQQGKALVMNLLAWYLTWQCGYVPCYITKKLDSLRADAIDKMNHGYVNTTVDEVATELGLSAIVAKRHHLKPSVGLLYKDFEIGTIPIFLIEPSNNVKVLKWIKNLTKLVGFPRYPVFIFDEVQELYTNESVSYFLTNRHLSKGFLEKDKIGGHFLIHKVVELCKQKGCAMIGITATPQRVLASDPEACPTIIYKIPCVAPTPGLKRIGYIDGSDEFQGAAFKAETDTVEIIRKILARGSTTMTDGKKQVRFLNIVTKRDNVDMKIILDTIKDNFPTLAYVKTFMQDSKEYREINIQELDHFFDLRHVSNEVITDGIMILIGKSREGAGITMKPSFKLSGPAGRKHHIRKIGTDTWTINGITDMQFCLGKNMEYSEQLFGRGSGWVDQNHNFTFWLSEGDIHDVRYGIIRTKRDMINKYKEGIQRGEVGPSSILNVINMCTKSMLFDPNDLYIRESNSNMGHITIGTTALPPIKSKVLDTTIYKISDKVYQQFKQAKDGDDGGNSDEGRKIRKRISEELKGLGVDLPERFQMPWSEERNKQILIACAQPKDDKRVLAGRNNLWQVNGYCVIREETMSVVIFKTNWEERLRFPHDLRLSSEKHVDLNDTICWKEAEGLYRYGTFNSNMCHRYAKSIQHWVLDVEAQKQVLDRIDKLVDLCIDSIRKKSSYNLFQNLHTLRACNSKRPADIIYARWISDLWKYFQFNFKDLHREMCQRLDKSNPGEAEQLLQDLDELLEPYFKKQFPIGPIVNIKAYFRQQPIPPPIVKIKVKLRSRPN